jgi:glycosyltransferase involved in cell wall biosynthesis
LKFSVIICAHNPNAFAFEQLLNSINGFVTSKSNYEVIIVDNNSNPRIGDSSVVQEFIKSHSEARIIYESKPGLTAARTTGIRSSKYDWLVFFDDDNKPNDDYLLQVQKGISEYSNVGAWGPASIEVVFANNKLSKWFLNRKYIFQEQFSNNTVWGSQIGSTDYYPYGTGLCIKKIIAEEYCKRVENGQYSLTDRNGKSMSSGGDLQMVLTAADLGFAVGKIGELKMVHYITANKTTYKQVFKLIYGLESSVYIAHAEVLNWSIEKINALNYMDSKNFLKIIYNNIYIQKNGLRTSILNLASVAGQQNGLAILKGQKHPSTLINIFAKLIK